MTHTGHLKWWFRIVKVLWSTQCEHGAWESATSIPRKTGFINSAVHGKFCYVFVEASSVIWKRRRPNKQ